jgi:hypothetical protein
MSQPAIALELRKHPRAQLRLPVRVRRQGQFGLRMETVQTIDVSRGGLLIHRAQPCLALARLWIAFPFDPAARFSVQPETHARVVRVENENGSGYRIALRLELPPRDSQRSEAFERRAQARLTFALPIFVRPAASRWPEESMTCDVSCAGASFETSHIYASGEEVIVKIPWGEWSRAGEIRARVVRVERALEHSEHAAEDDPEREIRTILTRVSLRWTKPTTSGTTQLARGANPEAGLRFTS